MDDAGLQPLIFGLGEWVNVLRVELGWVAWFVGGGKGGGGWCCGSGRLFRMGGFYTPFSYMYILRTTVV
jgi:hypothetical protein